MASRKQATPKKSTTPKAKAPPKTKTPAKPKTTTPRKKATPKKAAPPTIPYVICGTRQHELSTGLFATTAITPGTLVLTDIPLYTSSISILHPSSHTVAQEAALAAELEEKLDPSQRQDLAKLWRRGDRLWVGDFEKREEVDETLYMGLVCGSAIPLSVEEKEELGEEGGIGMVGVFRVLSRVNHACVPNCQVVWSASNSTQNSATVDDNGHGERDSEGDDGNGAGGEGETAKLYATHPIKPGQQLTISYVPNSTINQSYLLKTYGFVCMCKTFCLRSQDFKDRYTARLLSLSKLLTRLDQPIEGTGDIYLQHAHKALKCMRILGIADFRLVRLWKVVFERAVQKRLRVKAQFFAVHAYLAAERCEGKYGGSVERLVRDTNVAFGVGDAEGVDVEGGFVKFVERVRGEDGGVYLGFVDASADGAVTGEVFRKKCLVEMFGMKGWMIDLPGEKDVDGDEGLFVEEDDPIVDEEEVESSGREAEATPEKKENHRAKPGSFEKTPREPPSSGKRAKPTSSGKKKTTNTKRALPPVPLFPGFTNQDKSTELSPSEASEDFPVVDMFTSSSASKSFFPKSAKSNKSTKLSPFEDLPVVDMFTPSTARAKTSQDDRDRAMEEWQRQRTANQQHLRQLARSQVRAGVLSVGSRRFASASSTRGENGESDHGSSGRVRGREAVIDLTGEDDNEDDDE